jgi:hypothetical protein
MGTTGGRAAADVAMKDFVSSQSCQRCLAKAGQAVVQVTCSAQTIRYRGSSDNGFEGVNEDQ